jgi:hypothetical protein
MGFRLDCRHPSPDVGRQSAQVYDDDVDGRKMHAGSLGEGGQLMLDARMRLLIRRVGAILVVFVVVMPVVLFKDEMQRRAETTEEEKRGAQSGPRRGGALHSHELARYGRGRQGKSPSPLPKSTTGRRLLLPI